MQIRHHRYEHNSKAHIILISPHFKRLRFSISDFTQSFFICIWDIITLINLNFIQFYQSLIKVDLIDKRLLITSIDDVLVICEKGYIFTVSRFNGGWGELFNDYNLIEVLEFTSSSTKDSLDLLFYKHALNLGKSWERTLRPHRTVRINNNPIRLGMNLTEQMDIKCIYDFFRSRIMYLNKTLFWELFKSIWCFKHTLYYNIKK